MVMLAVNYLQVIYCEHGAVNRNKRYRKDQWYGKRKLMKAYLYNNQLKNLRRRQIALALKLALEVHGAIEW